MGPIVGDVEAVGSVAEADAPAPWQDDGTGRFHVTRRTLDALALLGFALPIAAYFWLIHRYSVNTIYADQWYDISLIAHPLSFSALWAQHNEHRILVPNLIVLVLAHATHLNIVFEEYLSGVVLCVALGLLVLSDRRAHPRTPWIFYCPVAFVLLSFVQAGSTLFGFQLSWYLSIMAFALALFLLDRDDPSTWALIGAIAAAVVGSLSAFEGLFIWPVGLLVLYRRRCSRGQALSWTACAVITVVAYFHNYRWTGNSYWYSHPISTIKFFFLAIGDVVGAQLNDPRAGNGAVLALGVLIFAVACWVIVNYGLRRGPQTGGSVGVALVCFGLLFTVTFTVGRVDAGLSLAGASQYTTFDLLILLGCYLARLHSPAPLGEHRRSERLSWPILRMVLVGAVLLQVALGTINGLTQARNIHNYEASISDITANIDTAPTTLVQLEAVASPEWIRHMAHVAEARRLSLFATSVAASYRREGLFPSFSTLSTDMLVPANGATVSGTTVLDAAANSPDPITKLTFLLSGRSYPDEVIGTARLTFGGWIYRWNTTTVARGTYMLRSEAYLADGKHALSQPVTVTVRD